MAVNANEDFKVHDVVVTSSQQFTAAGTLKRLTTVRFWVGTHGPFVEMFEAGSDSAAEIKSAIDRKTAALRSLMTSIG